MGEDTALAVLIHTLPGARLILCSLHRNEVDLFRPAPAGYVAERAFASLLDVSTCGRL
ncbi:MAG: hypothetical protein JOZ41_09210 [Chloroflexi bacterium]|nr:hypothetical protein [Chloroflexota bacterium]